MSHSKLPPLLVVFSPLHDPSSLLWQSARGLQKENLADHKTTCTKMAPADGRALLESDLTDQSFQGEQEGTKQAQWAVLTCSLSYSPDCRCLCPQLRWQSTPSGTIEEILTLCIEHACLRQFKGVAVFRLTFHMLHLEWLLGNEVLCWRWRVNPYNQAETYSANSYRACCKHHLLTAKICF